MSDVVNQEAIEKGLRTLWIIWTVMLAALFVYAFICLQLGHKIQQAANPTFPLPLLKNILFGITVATLLLTHFLRNYLLRNQFGSISKNVSPSVSPATNSSLLPKYASAVIVSLALCESIGIYGLVLFMLGDDFQTLLTFIGIAAIGMLYYRPKREEMEALAKSMRIHQV